VRLLGYAVGVALLGAAIVAVVRDREHLAHTLGSIRSSPAWLVVLLFVLPLLNWLLTAEMFRHLMKPRRYDAYVAPSLAEMVMLIGAAWLANYIPMRPGLFGRLAYHTKVNGAPLARGVQSIALAIACGGAAIIFQLVVAWASSLSSSNATGVAASFAPCAACFVVATCIRHGIARNLLMATAVRSLDVVVWMLRYMVVFRLAGGPPLGVRHAAAVAAVSQAAMLIPFVGNGLGVREFAVGLAGASLPEWYVGAAEANVAQPIALAADLLNRAGEIAAAVPVGLVCGWLLMHRLASNGEQQRATELNAGDRT